MEYRGPSGTGKQRQAWSFYAKSWKQVRLSEIPKGLTQTMYEFYVTDYGKHSDLHLKQNNIFFNGKEINSIKSCIGNIKPIVNNIIANTIFKNASMETRLGFCIWAGNGYTGSWPPLLQLSKKGNAKRMLRVPHSTSSHMLVK